MIFDPIRMREVSGGTLARIQNTEFEDSRPMGNVAMRQLDEVIWLWLVGLENESRDFLPRLLRWIEHAIDKGEKYGSSHNFHHMNLHSAAAACKWMISGVDELEDWNHARLLNGSICEAEKVYNKRDFSTIRLDDYLAYANLSGNYNHGIVEFEKYHKLKNIEAGTLKPREFAYASCLHQESGTFDAQALFSVGKDMLRNYMQAQWLGGGLYISAVIWLKIVYKYSNETSLSPLQTILKAYENMPDVPKPPFLKSI